jgi:hypothetical protein
MPYKLASDFLVWCYRHAYADMVAAVDSFLLIQAGKTRLLNMNDYITKGSTELRWVKNHCGALTILLTQFSYAKDLQKALAAPPQFSVRKVPANELIADAEKFRQKMLDAHSALILYLIPAITIWVKDCGKPFAFNYRSGLQEHAGIAESDCDISVISGALSHCFTTLWGADALAVTGCFTSPKVGYHRWFFTCLAPSRYANAGIRLDLTITARAMWRKIQAVLSR